MSYPPGPGFGGDPHGQGQQQPGGWGQQPDSSGWQQPGPGGWQPQDQGWGQQPQDSGGWGQQDPSWGQPPPAPAPAYGAQPGWDQQGYQPPPNKPNTGLIIGLVVAVVAALVLVVGAVVVVNRDDESVVATSSSTTTTTTTSTTTTSTSARPTTTTGSTGAKLGYNEYSGDWNFRLGDVALQAQWVQGKDHSSCAPIEEAGKLTDLGCKYAAELTWSAEGGALILTQFIVGMGGASTASAAVDGFDDGDVKLAPGTYVDHWETGKWRNGSEKEFLVITFATATAAVPAETVEKYLKYRHNDTTGALLFR
ncbi:hypothetical protein [Nocardia sp. NPDC050406]|uniref:hypothetical protein n=1 Tax=Nocardia sp. NPDC050406 TaxID=3364318 RepID=UPI0037AD2478